MVSIFAQSLLQLCLSVTLVLIIAAAVAECTLDIIARLHGGL